MCMRFSVYRPEKTKNKQRTIMKKPYVIFLPQISSILLSVNYLVHFQRALLHFEILWEKNLHFSFVHLALTKDL